MSPSRRTRLAIDAAKEAGAAILPWYRTAPAGTTKHDGSPLTDADRAAHRILDLMLAADAPVVSEESSELRLEATRYWLVDPLDGTKDFLAANDEFTVNVAFIDDGRPVLGVVYAPALAELYVGVRGEGAWCERKGVRIPCTGAPRREALRMATSRFHDHPDTEVFARANGVAECVPIGSALKYGRLITGEVDIYPRLQGTSEWDTAAGQAILESADGGIFDWHTGEPLRYGKAGRRNGRFIAVRSPYCAADFARREYEPGLL